MPVLLPVVLVGGGLYAAYEIYDYLSSPKKGAPKPSATAPKGGLSSALGRLTGGAPSTSGAKAAPTPSAPTSGLAAMQQKLDQALGQKNYGPQPQPAGSTTATIHTQTPGSIVNVRATPVTGKVQGTIPDKASVFALGVFDEKGNPTTLGGNLTKFWYKIQDSLSSLAGYVRADFVSSGPGVSPVSTAPVAGPAVAPGAIGPPLTTNMVIHTQSPGSSVNVRAKPLNGTVLGMLKDGTSVIVDNSKTADDKGNLVTFSASNATHQWLWVGDVNSPLTGYVRSDFVKVA